MSSPDHLTAVARDARALAARGDLDGARALLDRVLDPATTALGPDHPEVLGATRLLASLHRDLGDLSGARRILEEALAAGQFTLGDDNPALLPLSYDLATLADELGNRHEARRNFTRLLRQGPAALGPDHEYVRAARRYLGVTASPATGAPTAPAPAQPPAHPAPPSAPPTAPVTPMRPVTPAPFPAPPGPVSPGRTAPGRPTADTVPPAPDTVQRQPQRFPPAPDTFRSLPDTVRPAPDSFPPAADTFRVQPSWASRDSDAHRHSRAPLLVLVVVAAMALLGGGIAAYLVLHAPQRGPGQATPSTPTTPSAEAGDLRPPGDLALRDNGTSVTLTWTDPSRGTVPFVVAGGRADNALKPLGSAGSGETTFTVYGLNSAPDYCFLVAAVYSTQHTVPSDLACTRRGASPPARR
ncbi:tetratricopeptide repeat protein [Planosporangium sp. 12N6]|uniref:fibronectin type III domain-containing protein n=1 Tax=Planosporangium spinosum TaxID=3402278 RepID=UPI003CE7ACE3